MADDTQHAPPARGRHVSVMVTVWLILLAVMLWFGLIAALLGGAWLLVGKSDDKTAGPEITLTLHDASGVHKGTAIRLLNVDVGSVTAVSFNERRDGVIAKARMYAGNEGLLTEETKFWLGKPHLDRSGITGLNSLVSTYIEMSPGKGGGPKREFPLLAARPPDPDGAGGAYFQLTGEADGALLAPGAPVLYRNIEVGQVAEANFDPRDNTAVYRIFIRNPNEVLVGENTYFWLAAGLNAGVDNGEFKVAVPPVSALLRGGTIAFDNPEIAGKGGAVAENSGFVLHRNADMLGKKASANAFRLVAFFDQSVATLREGSPVVYKGVTVGFVENPQFFGPGDKAKLFGDKNIPVSFHLSPELFGEQVDPAQWRKSVQAALDNGLAATIGSSNPVLGRGQIELADAVGAKPLRPLPRYRDLPVIGTRKGGVEGIILQVNALLEKINQLPLDKTVAELNRALAHLDRLSGGKDAQALPGDVRNTLAQVQKTLAGVSPDAPLYREVQKTLDTVNATLERAEPLLRALGAKPDALIFGDSREDPVPKGKR